MKLNNTSQYAIRIMTYIVNGEKDTLFSAKQISADLQIPYKYLTRIMTQLVDAKLILSIRGREGGYKLAKDDISQICVYDILKAVNESLNTSSCILGQGCCDENKKCVLHDEWKKPRGLIVEMFKNTTLEMIRHKKDAFLNE